MSGERALRGYPRRWVEKGARGRAAGGGARASCAGSSRVRVGLLRRRRRTAASAMRRGAAHRARRGVGGKGRQSGRADARTGRAPRASRAAGGAASQPVAPAAADSTRIRFSICRGADEMTFSISEEAATRRDDVTAAVTRPLRYPVRVRVATGRAEWTSVQLYNLHGDSLTARQISWSPISPSLSSSSSSSSPAAASAPVARSSASPRAARRRTDARRIVAG